MCNWNGSDQETFDDIIGEEALMPTDKLAFACLYLPDEKLSDYINRMWDNVRNQGDISGNNTRTRYLVILLEQRN